MILELNPSRREVLDQSFLHLLVALFGVVVMFVSETDGGLGLGS